MNALGIRNYEFAKLLSANCEVTIATNRTSNHVDEKFQVAAYRTKRGLSRIIKMHDIIICQGINPPLFPLIASSGKRLVLDIYAPSAFEVLERFPGINEKLLTFMHKRDVSWANTQIWAADFVLCPTDKLVDFWFGVMNTIGKLNPKSYLQDMRPSKFIEVVEFGLSPEPPKHTKQVIKGVIPGIKANDTVLLWNSGIWGWLDPITLIYAMEKLWHKRPDIKLNLLRQGQKPFCCNCHLWYCCDKWQIQRCQVQFQSARAVLLCHLHRWRRKRRALQEVESLPLIPTLQNHRMSRPYIEPEQTAKLTAQSRKLARLHIAFSSLFLLSLVVWIFKKIFDGVHSPPVPSKRKKYQRTHP